jgi:hypothetical protein
MTTQFGASLTDDVRVVIYDHHNTLIIEARDYIYLKVKIVKILDLCAYSRNFLRVIFT